MQVMPTSRFRSFTELREYIYATLCQREQLAEGVFPMTEQVLKQGGQQCGVLFSIHGPRSVVFNAVLETRGNAIHFYGSSGERFLTTPLGSVPQPLAT